MPQQGTGLRVEGRDYLVADGKVNKLGERVEAEP
jgi:hypothetical protein